MSNKVIHVLYNDDDILMDAVKQTRAAHHHIEEIYTPFPVHGLDKAMGLAPTRLAICSFLYGLVGLSVATSMLYHFLMEVAVHGDADQMVSFFENTGAVEVKVIEKH